MSNLFAEFACKQLYDYVHSRSEIEDSFYKHLVINTQSRTFEDPNYVNTIGSWEQASSCQDATGDLPVGIYATRDLPSGKRS